MDALCLNLALWSASILPTFLLIDFVEPWKTSVLSKSAFRWMRVPSMAIRRLNTTVQPMNDKLSALVSADLSSSIYCLFLGGIVATGALSSATFYIPATIGIVNDMMSRTSHKRYFTFPVGRTARSRQTLAHGGKSVPLRPDKTEKIYKEPGEPYPIGKVLRALFSLREVYSRELHKTTMRIQKGREHMTSAKQTNCAKYARGPPCESDLIHSSGGKG